MLDKQKKIETLFDRAKENHAIQIFDDGTENILMPRIKIERYILGDKYRYNILNTSSEIFMPLEDWLIEFALENGVEKLSDSMSFTYAVKKLEKVRRKKVTNEKDEDRKMHEIGRLSNKIRILKSKSINLNLIKENYVTRIKPKNGKTNPINSQN